jgi:hypothetical protein
MVKNRQYVRRGIVLIDGLIGIVVLALLLLPLAGVTTGTTRQVRGVDQRLVLELHARRTQAELLTTTYEALASNPDVNWVVNLGEPAQGAGYDEYRSGSSETTTVSELTSGLLVIKTVLEWPDLTPGGRKRTVVIKRILNRPTTSLLTRVPLKEVEL